jgi:hypothetical protein
MPINEKLPASGQITFNATVLKLYPIWWSSLKRALISARDQPKPQSRRPGQWYVNRSLFKACEGSPVRDRRRSLMGPAKEPRTRFDCIDCCREADLYIVVDLTYTLP